MPKAPDWKFLPEFGRVETETEVIAYIAGGVKPTLEAALANGRLIAAAPEMRKVLEDLHTFVLGHAAYLETCATDVIVENLPDTIAYLKNKRELIEAALLKAQ